MKYVYPALLDTLDQTAVINAHIPATGIDVYRENAIV